MDKTISEALVLRSQEGSCEEFTSTNCTSMQSTNLRSSAGTTSPTKNKSLQSQNSIVRQVFSLDNVDEEFEHEASDALKQERNGYTDTGLSKKVVY